MTCGRMMGHVVFHLQLQRSYYRQKSAEDKFPNPPYTTAQDDSSIASPQGLILLHNKLPVSSTEEFSVVFSWIWRVFPTPNIIPDFPGQAKDILMEDVEVF
eukprot:superscaffoldBa00000564_g5659